ncbi:peptidase U35 phage prohead HK97 [Burkholderia sp. H160]|nr:peptidase U35 phage prohead HK97 [Burkholderia sp. H160]
MSATRPAAREVKHATSLLLLRADSTSEELREIVGVATTPAVDSFSDILESMGAVYETPLPLLWQHRREEPIGSVLSAEPTREGIRFRARVARIDTPGSLRDRCNEAWEAIKSQLVRAVSVGFVPLETVPREKGGKVYRRWRWVELSVVTIGANTDAKILGARHMGEAEQLVERMLAEDRALRSLTRRAPARIVKL